MAGICNTICCWVPWIHKLLVVMQLVAGTKNGTRWWVQKWVSLLSYFIHMRAMLTKPTSSCQTTSPVPKVQEIYLPHQRIARSFLVLLLFKLTGRQASLPGEFCISVIFVRTHQQCVDTRNAVTFLFPLHHQHGRSLQIHLLLHWRLSAVCDNRRGQR